MGAIGPWLLGLYLEIRVIPVLLWSVTAITLGTALAWRDGAGTWVPGYLGALGLGVLLQGVVAHCVNDVADWRSGTDGDPAPRVLSGGSKVVPSGYLGEWSLVACGVVALAAAAALGLALAAAAGWWLLAFGLTGAAGAVLYTLPPVRLAYRPFAGEVVAFACVWAAGAGAYALQRGSLGAAAAGAAAVHAAACVAMLLLHHRLDRGPDARALPPKVTSVVYLGDRARGYLVAWAAAAAAGGAALALAVNPAFWLAAGALAVALAAQVAATRDDPGSVTRAELVVILASLAGGLGTAGLLSPPLRWALLAPVVLVPLELVLAGRAHAPLMAARAQVAPPSGLAPGPRRTR